MTDTPVTTRASWLSLIALVPAGLTIGLDSTVLSVALPTLATELHATTSQLQWFVMAYTIAFAAAMIPAGLLGDRWGRRRTMLVALVLFGIGSVASAYSGSATALIAARILLGLGAAAIAPLAMSALPALFGPAERPRATTTFMTASMLGFPIGPILGGWLLTHAWWGWVFLINIPVVIIAIIAVALWLPEGRNGDRHRIDLPGIALSSISLALISYGLTEAGRRGWTNPIALAIVAVGFVAGAVFITVERRTEHPLVNMGLFSNIRFSAGTAVGSALSLVMFGMMFAVPQFSEAIIGTNAQGAGIRLLPLIGGMLVSGVAADRLVKRLGFRPLIIAGLAVLAIGLGMGALTSLTSGDAHLATWVALCGVGMGLALPTAMDTALGALDHRSAGTGAALLQAMRMVAGTLGAAVLGSVLNSMYRGALPAADLAQLPAEAAAAVRDSVGSGLAVAGQIGSPDLATTVRSAFVHGMNGMLWVSAAVAVVAVIAAIVALPARLTTEGAEPSEADSSTDAARPNAHEDTAIPALESYAPSDGVITNS